MRILRPLALAAALNFVCHDLARAQDTAPIATTRISRSTSAALNFIFGGADTLSGELPLSQEIELGGIRTFPGLRPGELRGDEYWFVGTSYNWRLFDIVPLFGNALYAGVRFQGGRMQNQLAVGNQDTLLGLSGSLGGRTPIGPFLVAIGYVDNGSWQLQFTLGRPLNEGSMLDELH